MPLLGALLFKLISLELVTGRVIVARPQGVIGGLAWRIWVEDGACTNELADAILGR